MTKKEIRMLATQLRTALSPQDLYQLNLQLVERFASLDLSSVKTIHLFLPIEEKKEPDTFMIIEWLTVNHPGIKIIVPRADFDTALMSHYEYTGKQSLVKNLYNILEPEKGTLHTGDVDLVLVPLLGFDRRGYRVGYGKGFYDRFLAPIKTKKIGLSLFDSTDHIDDVHDNDIRLDACITPKEIICF
ncbi:MAG: 5-formyltetrahydrofolate cyclo-ligase [Pedobacter sp.]|nr:MAG: 5-formyltetrahydrofolate cyclo-ligase [Pedobacter sp.]